MYVYLYIYIYIHTYIYFPTTRQQKFGGNHLSNTTCITHGDALSSKVADPLSRI